jgi:cytochrome c-type biogenesis protein CcmH/NrfG
MAISLPIYFLISNQRLRGLVALAPVVAALLATFTSLNEVYLAYLSQKSVPAAVEQVLPIVWLSCAIAGLYGILWGFIDRRWRPPRSVVRAIGGVVLAGSIVALVIGASAASKGIGNSLTLAEQKWEASKANPAPGDEWDRYLITSNSSRYATWQVAWEDFASHPLLGVGTRNYEATYYRLRVQEHRELYVRQPHSLPLEVLAERGLIGGILFFGFLATCLGASLWRRFRDLDSDDKAQVGALTAALTYWFVHSTLEWFWQLPAVTLPAMVYLAMLVGPWQRVEAAPARWPLRAIGAGVAVFAIVVVAPLYVADRYLAQSYASTTPEETLVAVERAQRLNPVSPELLEREGELATAAGDWDRAERAYEEATRLNPEHYFPYVLLARYYEREGQPEEALSSYRKAIALNPLDEQLSKEAAGKNEPDTDAGWQDFRDLCRKPTLPLADQNCPPHVRESI